ncbi:prepilin-type N-terminal cleavage/methylation domain-containing protein [bacterium]|nr:prepilin-type N-terminal cleavage/methylation domain-containing protein [bacterium]
MSIIRGFSLIEVVIAAAIAMAAILPLYYLLGSSNVQVAVSADEILVTNLAIELLDQAENLHFMELNKSFSENLPLKSNSWIVLKKLSNQKVCIGEFPGYLELDGVFNVSPIHADVPKFQNLGLKIDFELSFFPKERLGNRKKTIKFSSLVVGD